MADRFLHNLKASGSMGNRYKEEKNFHLQQKGNSKTFNKVPSKDKNNEERLNTQEDLVEKVNSFAKNMEYLSQAMISFSEVQKEHMKVVVRTLDTVHSVVKLLSGKGVEIATPEHREVEKKQIPLAKSEALSRSVIQPKLDSAREIKDMEYKRTVYDLVFDMRKKRIPWIEIAKELNRRKIKTPMNKIWTKWNAGDYCRSLQKIFGDLP